MVTDLAKARSIPDKGDAKALDAAATALLLIGCQEDFFVSGRTLHDRIEDNGHIPRVLANTVELIEQLAPSEVLIVSTPLVFTADYSEIPSPVGILADIKAVGAFQFGSPGSKGVAELSRFAGRIREIPGKRGLDAFANTALDDALRQSGITDVVLAGALSSVCLDSTGRSAFERGFGVTVLSDCTFGRTHFEHRYYCEHIFPLYASVIDSTELRRRVDASDRVVRDVT
ncbi:MAG: hypothetical protein NVS3B21_23940 [Acidimicrobiales bacterium]